MVKKFIKNFFLPFERNIANAAAYAGVGVILAITFYDSYQEYQQGTGTYQLRKAPEMPQISNYDSLDTLDGLLVNKENNLDISK